MNNIFLAPHPDDEALFGSYIIQRAKPLIVVCTDGTIHEKKFGIPIQRRRDESIASAKILGVEIEFLGIPEEELSPQTFWPKFYGAIVRQKKPNIVFVPTKTGGQPHHDLISDYLTERDFSGLMYYGTYSRQNFSPTGDIPIFPTDEERATKEKALACFESQLGLNKAHFDAVRDVPEYLSFKQC